MMRPGALVRILLVDDEAPILSSTAMLLESFGHEVRTTASHADVVSLIEEDTPDLVLHDVRMPGLVIGQQVLALRSSHRGRAVRIVLFSAGMDLEEVASALPVDGCLEKPFKPHELMHVLSAPAASPMAAVGAVDA